MSHVGHDNIGSALAVNTNQLHHIRVVEIRHYNTLFNQAFKISSTEET